VKLAQLLEGITMSQANKALRDAGYAEKLVKGKGYLYFIGGKSDRWKETGVYAWTPQSAEDVISTRNHLSGDDN